MLIVLKKDEGDLNLALKFKIDDFVYTVHVTSDILRCFGCGAAGHLIRAGPPVSVPAAGPPVVEPLVSRSVGQSVSRSVGQSVSRSVGPRQSQRFHTQYHTHRHSGHTGSRQ